MAIPSEHRNGVIQGYRVVAIPSEVAGVHQDLNTPPNLEAFQLTGLTPDILYNISIAAFTGAGEGPISTTQILLLPRGNCQQQIVGHYPLYSQ